MRQWFLALVACAFIASCGGSDEESSQSDGNSASTRDAVALLNSWTEELLPLLLLVQERRAAVEAEERDQASEQEERIKDGLERVEKFGPEAREKLEGDEQTELESAVVDAGDAWTEWANTLLTQPPAGDVDQAQVISDLAAEAIRLHGEAYEAAGQPIPPLFRP